MAKALSTTQDVLETADHFFAVADALHRRLNSSKPLTQGATPTSDDLYGVLIQEYGLRARANILRNAAKSHLLAEATTEHADLVYGLQRAAQTIPRIDHLSHLSSFIATVTTLCVSISPGKGHVVDFMFNELKRDLERFAAA